VSIGLANTPRIATTDSLVQLKKFWTVSVSALAYRLHSLKLISDWHYRTLCIQVANRGYRKTEPAPAPRETSQILGKVFAAMRAEAVTKAEIAKALNVHATEIDGLVFGLALMVLSGSGKGSRLQRVRSGVSHRQIKLVDKTKRS
jgi:hypothetical protein